MNNFLCFLIGHNFCKHPKLNLNIKFQYCPDCGELVELSWYVVRCRCCDVKREAKLKFGEIFPVDNFCTNCGSEEFYVQKIEDLKFYDIHHAVLFKETVNICAKRRYTQVWADSCEPAHTYVLKLLPMLTEHKSVS